MKLFHASIQKYRTGGRIFGALRQYSLERQFFEDKFAQFRCAHEFDRRKNLFAADNEAFAAKYLEAELTQGAERYLYAVGCQSGSSHPMVLINLLFHANSDGRFEGMAQEYWSPSRDWACLSLNRSRNH